MTFVHIPPHEVLQLYAGAAIASSGTAPRHSHISSLTANASAGGERPRHAFSQRSSVIFDHEWRKETECTTAIVASPPHVAADVPHEAKGAQEYTAVHPRRCRSGDRMPGTHV